MGKINIALASGSMLDKPLVSAFKGNNNIYVVLDNEVNGTMGLPIILVSKFENNRLIKINDQNEWNAVKEILRNIIAGNQVDYTTIPEKVDADDMFFSQLTLPVASFESLKANYKPVEDMVADFNAVNNQMNLQDNSFVSPTPMPNIANEAPVMPQSMPNAGSISEPIVPPVQDVQPQVVEPVPPVMPEAPVAQEMDMYSTHSTSMPSVEPISQPNTNNIDFSVDKEAFLKACENMFDALVAKFNKMD